MPFWNIRSHLRHVLMLSLLLESAATFIRACLLEATWATRLEGLTQRLPLHVHAAHLTGTVSGRKDSSHITDSGKRSVSVRSTKCEPTHSCE